MGCPGSALRQKSILSTQTEASLSSQPIILLEILGPELNQRRKNLLHMNCLLIFSLFFFFNQHFTSSFYPVSPHSPTTPPQLLYTTLNGGCGCTPQPEYLGRGTSVPGRVSARPGSHGLPARCCLCVPWACPPAKTESCPHSFPGNLTKHMKSKAHSKKCQETGVLEELEAEEGKALPLPLSPPPHLCPSSACSSTYPPPLPFLFFLLCPAPPPPLPPLPLPCPLL